MKSHNYQALEAELRPGDSISISIYYIYIYIHTYIYTYIYIYICIVYQAPHGGAARFRSDGDALLPLLPAARRAIS